MTYIYLRDFTLTRADDIATEKSEQPMNRTSKTYIKKNIQTKECNNSFYDKGTNKSTAVFVHID